MNSTFRDETPEVGGNISIYSVVNSIIDSCDVDRVQISIEGSTAVSYTHLDVYKRQDVLHRNRSCTCSSNHS